MISLWKGKIPIYFEVIRPKVTIGINIVFDNGSFPHDKFSSCGSGKTLFYFWQIFNTMILCYAYIYYKQDGKTDVASLIRMIFRNMHICCI